MNVYKNLYLLMEVDFTAMQKKNIIYSTPAAIIQFKFPGLSSLISGTDVVQKKMLGIDLSKGQIHPVVF